MFVHSWLWASSPQCYRRPLMKSTECCHPSGSTADSSSWKSDTKTPYLISWVSSVQPKHPLYLEYLMQTRGFPSHNIRCFDRKKAHRISDHWKFHLHSNIGLYFRHGERQLY